MQDKTITIQTDPITHVKFTLNGNSLSVHKSTQSKPDHDIGHRYVLQAAFDDNLCSLKVAYLAKKKTALHLVIIEGRVDQSRADHAGQWSESVMKAVYDAAGIKRSLRFMVFVNPYGGKKKAVSIFKKTVEPALKVAGCSLEVLYTTHQGHAQEIAKTLSLDYDGVIAVSGDGLVHEILNGLAVHADSTNALSIPVAPIPTGSGNGLSINLLGVEEGFDVLAATLNAIKGQPMKVDILSFVQGNRRTISFMSQAVGLMADLDVGTDNLRWMGPSRFLYGLLRGILTKKISPIQLSYKLAEDDKYKMALQVANRRQITPDETTLDEESGDDAFYIPPSATTQRTLVNSPAFPPAKYLEDMEEDEEGWTIFPHPIIYLYAGKGPYVGRDFMAFPVSLPDDGLVDITVMTDSSRGDMIASMGGAAEGLTYWHPKVHYVKAHSYRVKPLQKEGHLAVDGEAMPFEEFQVEVIRGGATLMSLYGHYVAKFEPRSPLKPAAKSV